MPILIPLATAAISGAQAYSAARKRKKGEQELERFNNSEKADDGIMDFYNKALSRYSSDPYTSNLYNAQKRNIERGTAQGLNSFQDRRSGVAGVSSLVQKQNDSLLNAASNAEAQQGQQLSQLGQASSAKAGEKRRIFENKYNLLAMKAGQAATTQNMATQGTFNSLGNAASIAYGGSGTGGGNSFGNLFSGSQGRSNAKTDVYGNVLGGSTNTYDDSLPQ